MKINWSPRSPLYFVFGPRPPLMSKVGTRKGITIPQKLLQNPFHSRTPVPWFCSTAAYWIDVTFSRQKVPETDSASYTAIGILIFFISLYNSFIDDSVVSFSFFLTELQFKNETFFLFCFINDNNNNNNNTICKFCTNFIKMLNFA